MSVTTYQQDRAGRPARHLTSTHQAVITTRCWQAAGGEGCAWNGHGQRWSQLQQDDAQAAVIRHVEESGHTVAQDVTVQIRTRPVSLVDTSGAVAL